MRYSELGGTAAHTTYAYDGLTNLLTRARNFDGVQVNVGYESTSLYGTSATDDARRVKSLETVATDGCGRGDDVRREADLRVRRDDARR